VSDFDSSKQRWRVRWREQGRQRTRRYPDELRRLSVPTLVIWGDHGPVGPVGVARTIARLLPEAQLEILPGGHVPASATRSERPPCYRSSCGPEPRGAGASLRRLPPRQLRLPSCETRGAISAPRIPKDHRSWRNASSMTDM
jgi:hypothetical protein